MRPGTLKALRHAVSFAIMTCLWAVLSGSFSLRNLLLGANIGILVLALCHYIIPREPLSSGTTVTPRVFLKGLWVLIPFFFYQVLKSSLRVARHTLSLNPPLRPGILRYPLRLKSPLGILLLSNFVTLTPGTMTVDFNTREWSLYIHCLEVPVDGTSQGLETTISLMEMRIQELTE